MIRKASSPKVDQGIDSEPKSFRNLKQLSHKSAINTSTSFPNEQPLRWFKALCPSSKLPWKSAPQQKSCPQSLRWVCWWDPTASPAIKPCAQVSRWRERRWSQRHGWLFQSRAVLNVKGTPTHTLRHLHQTNVPCRDHLTSSWPSAPTQTTNNFFWSSVWSVDVGDLN